MAYEYNATRRVEFADTDMAGIMHFSNFFRFMETAEHAFYRSLGFSVILENRQPPLSFPRVRAECDYRAPLRFEDEVQIHLLVSSKKAKVLAYQFRFLKLNGDVPAEVARGSLTVVCVMWQPDGSIKAVAIPPEIADKLQVAPGKLLE